MPTATTRAPRPFASSTARTVASGTSYRSGNGSAASRAGSPVDESPAACVTAASPTPRARSASTTPNVSGRPAEGISIAQGREPNGVCTCHRASDPAT